MKPYLLLGAGFSRNWGGWLASEVFEFLLGDAAVTRNAPLRDLLWKHQQTGGFEAALDELRKGVQRETSQQPLVVALESAVSRMFDAMNRGYNLQQFEFRHSIVDRHPLQTFLSRFTAIFTLNQDMLLERHYLSDKDNKLDFESWKQWQLPGMRLLTADQEKPISPPATKLWQPSDDYVIEPGQPIFKLHGSSNWRTSDLREMIILGGGKKESINRFPILRRYFDEFSSRLFDPEARLMVIGYSFRDDHINEVLQTAIAKGLKLFVIDPNGSDVARVINTTARSGQIYSKTKLEEDLQTALIGASRRSVRDIFGNDEIERAKIMRFFEAPAG